MSFVKSVPTEEESVAAVMRRYPQMAMPMMEFSETILRTFNRLLESAKGCDPDGIITDALRGSAHGQLCRIIEEQRRPADIGLEV